MMYIMMNIKSVYFNLSITITEICCIFIKVLFLMNYNLKSSRELYAQKNTNTCYSVMIQSAMNIAVSLKTNTL